ncbi:hypothetical protein JOF56_008495 [Kibdelosporangium banguiense]|uniref:Uncharacterized protein n=1 Tax=Kibdelosporangium banguiense TaxID=1365924 RepID=A0ABS4TUM1_9PSEU|nr:hypothetical protein [Kibdelosporangium banguiense]MBP2328110.1 hypothetical protein [Kibdelosporangium banguiense]
MKVTSRSDGACIRLRGGPARYQSVRTVEHLGEHFDHALLLYNMMFDPREILDLITAGMPEEIALRRLTNAYYAALRGWIQSEI